MFLHGPFCFVKNITESLQKVCIIQKAVLYLIYQNSKQNEKSIAQKH